MSSSAAGGAPLGTDDRVYRAVAAMGSVDEVRRAIERSRSTAAVNQAGRDGETPLRAARRLRRNNIVGLLLEHGAEGGDGDRNAAVCWCVHENDLAGLRRLIEAGASVDSASESGTTPLMLACNFSRRADRGLSPLIR